MNATESEAKKRWCPFARLSEMGGTYNRCGPAADLQCIGSACMAWRWHGDVVKEYDGPGYIHPHHGTPAEGFCGLAGKP